MPAHRMTTSTIAAGALCLIAGQAGAQSVLYENYERDDFFSGVNHPGISAEATGLDDVAFATDVTVSEIELTWIISLGIQLDTFPFPIQVGEWDNAFVVSVFEDIGGRPGDLVATTTINNAAYTVIGTEELVGSSSTASWEVRESRLAFGTPVELVAGTYWFAVQADDIVTFPDSSNITWHPADRISGTVSQRLRPFFLEDLTTLDEDELIANTNDNDSDLMLRVYGEASGPMGCNPADLAEDFGVLDLSDIGVFVDAFTAADAAADLNGDSVFDLGDIGLFVDAFTAGCP